MTTSRLEAFSDGVLAIAITLLILDVRVPSAGEDDLWSALGHEWPSFVAFVISFAVIGIIWVNHHTLVQQVATTTRTLLFLNMLLLLTVVWLPFPTALLARYIRAGDDAHVAAAVYGASMTLIGLTFIALWTYLVKNDAVRVDGFTADGARAARQRTIAGPAAYVLTVPLAFISPVACIFVWAAMALYFVRPTGTG